MDHVQKTKTHFLIQILDRHRILFIGDSFTEGAGLPFEQTFVGMFSQGVPDVDVLNAGSSQVILLPTEVSIGG